MNREQQIRYELLLQLYSAKGLALSVANMHKTARYSDLDYKEAEIKFALIFLKGQKMCEEITDPTTGVIRYAITSVGILEHEKGDS